MTDRNQAGWAHKARRALLTLIPLLVLGGALLIASRLLETSPQAGRRPPPERQARLVQVEPAQRFQERITLTAWGVVKPARELHLRAQLNARVASVADALDPGVRVGAGTVLVQLEQADFRLALANARADLTRAQADLALEMGQQAVARREYELLGSDVSEQERRLMLREPQLASARAAVAAAENRVAEAELALRRTRINAPFPALVVERQAAPGSLVSSGTDLARLVGVERWWVELAVPVNALRWLEFPTANGEPGSRVRLYDQAAWGEGVYREGRLIRLYGGVEEQGRLARLLVEVSDPLASQTTDAPPLLLGSFLEARISGRRLDDAIAVDPAWLRGGDRVWVMGPDDRLDMRPVEVLHRGRERVLLRGELRPGERIVTTPISGAAQGMPLRLAGAGSDGQR
ncbi:efflux RND transporter periplasmic adaptor subunit [Alkalilimnicola sp. S0819]|uniref:efflux RND transporter periplasmic adaptor subunit n=1 Tax=Alkalilimnicola sp. S0819 TaxID=2613922 RepID=UPI0012614062|nr:efflux RND transporter periplasmic adaptor subunit [Alkalilimnicola sp. S0819]KAB7627657.1 efflux RND transporter periplasmic adaptor subunit [Alkalilimnicola sp. S0819]MPQ15824.1 efflux RND transporter periplasmic adaptor subunit [Alkalilimnicola sp. S0819]